ncbi:MAG: TonB-dependent receptor [Verrucomicrobia bacterium]|nr:TonB-dependent receptor [Verrucomicrobiota bacterium]
MIAVILLFTFFISKAQDGGAVAGVVVSTWDGTPLPGVVVSVRGTTLAAQTDATGKFELKGVPPGDQVLRFSKSGYAAAVVTEVRVLLGQTTTVNGNLRPEFYDMDEYEVTAEEFADQTAEILFERRESSSMMDALGSDMFKNLAVGDAAGALSKVTGASVADGKYAVIRGLADRYTFTTLNGLELPSADPDRKAFQLDLMPSKFIEQLNVYKTFTPDMSGGFAGGSIDIVTKSYPEEFLVEFRVGTAYNTQASLRDDFLTSKHESKDWLGSDDGTRALPDAVRAQSPSGGQNYPPAVKASFESSQFAPVETDSPLDASTEFLLGGRHQLFGRRIGYLAGFNYKQEHRFYDDGVVRSYDEGGTVLAVDKTVAKGTIEYQWGALANLSFELAEGHELKFNYLRVQSAEDEASRAVGQQGDITSIEDGTYMDQSVINWTERSLSYYQLVGEHLVPQLQDVKFDWGAAYSVTTQEDPDFRVFQFRADPQNSTYNSSLTAAQPNAPTRYWRDLEENNTSYRADLTIPVPSYNSRENAIKTGVALNHSQRDYFQRGIYALGTTGHPFNSVGDPNMWMAPANLGFVNVRNFPANTTYDGEQEIQAGYLMADWAALEWLQFVGGARFEATEITVDAFNLTQNRPEPSGRLEQDDWLPSLSAIVRLPKEVELRAAWSRTVVRPTYREIAPVAIYDVFKGRSVLGNPGLQMSASENFDLRAAWYPRPGEILAASVFAKRIEEPIELSALRTDYTQIRYENFEKADVYGVEAEVQIKLDRLWELLGAFSLGANAAYIQSEVPLTQVQILNRASYGETATTRALYDQPEYIFNANLTWDNPSTRTTVTLSGGVVGERLVLVGLSRPDEFEQPAPELNLFIRQRLGKNWDVRFTARNLLNPKYEVAQTWPNAGKVVLESYTKGITFGLSVGCEF